MKLLNKESPCVRPPKLQGQQVALPPDAYIAHDAAPGDDHSDVSDYVMAKPY
jgi:hypothetical protein